MLYDGAKHFAPRNPRGHIELPDLHPTLFNLANLAIEILTTFFHFNQLNNPIIIIIMVNLVYFRQKTSHVCYGTLFAIIYWKKIIPI